jgi:acyl CoA:acetate/3-ketoacid CoA transferase beta subunit
VRESAQARAAEPQAGRFGILIGDRRGRLGCAGQPENVVVADACGSVPLTGANVVDLLITDLAIFARPDRKSPFELIERAPGVTADEIKAKTPAKFL